MLTIYKQKGAEPTFKCGNCGVSWKNSWLEHNQLNNTCPSCFSYYDLDSANVIKLTSLKQKYKLPKIVKLNLSLNKLTVELNEKYNIEFNENNIKQGNDKYINKLLINIEQIRIKIKKLERFCDINSIDINSVY